jgi:hypothetical protein
MSPVLRLIPVLLAAGALLAPAASASSWTVTGHSKQGKLAFRVHNDSVHVWTTDFHVVTRCGTRIVARRLDWGPSSEFRFSSKDRRFSMYTYVFTGPSGGGYGWVRDRRANGCDSGKVRFKLDED